MCIKLTEQMNVVLDFSLIYQAIQSIINMHFWKWLKKNFPRELLLMNSTTDLMIMAMTVRCSQMRMVLSLLSLPYGYLIGSDMMAQAPGTRKEIKNRHCEGTEQALSLSPAEDKR